ncbi:DUF6492 family protein [Paenibacillus sp. CF384]|uniref:DUF6492 family protein n=1 Tax=Paenibacillus sp. CF384 TaxID=1884382 RepID=UPI00089B5174|nr:DUF6492 family protein [Paenibacillus sp. CF384]SDX80648.1 hypothetical protein SAMN05518855_102266 [Paenibacillus sp. CF384]
MSAPIKSRASNARIDVLIPAIEKDLSTLPYVIDAVRKQVKHPIGRFMIVAPNRVRMRNLCKRKRCTFVNENRVLPITKRNINYRSKKWERSGWMFQQLLKMGGDRLCTSKYFLVIDADTILIRPHVFRTGKKTLFYTRSWSQPEYFRTYRKLMGKRAASPTSFVAHYMLFEKAKLRQLKRTIAAKHGMSWYSAILRKMDKTKQFAFSEFETYGNFLYAQNPGGIARRKALNKSLSTNIARMTPNQLKRLAKSYRSLSFHKRKGYSRKAAGKRK